MVRFGQILGALLLFFGVSSSAWCMPWVTNASGQVTWMRNNVWEAAQAVKYMGIEDATADGAGGITLSTAADIGVDGAVVPFTFAESSSAAEVAAAAAFLPETAIYAIAGAAIGALVWDAATQSYAIQQAPGPTTGATCSDGTAAYVLNNGGVYYDAASLWASLSAGLTNFTLDSSSGWNSSGQLVVNVDEKGAYWGNYTTQPGVCDDGSSPIASPGQKQDVPPSNIPPYILPWLQSNPGQSPPLAGKEGAAGHAPDAGNGPALSGPSTTSLPPVTTTTTNPDGSKSTSTTTTTINWNYSGPNASGSTSTKTTSSTTPAPTASNPNPTPTPGPTTNTSAPAPAPSSAPQSPFVPPTIPIPTPSAVPPGVINLPIPTIDNTSGTCPAPIVLNLGLPGAETLTRDLTPWCTLATNLRPLVLTAAGLAAAFLLVR
jgi:hypothetical protein